MKSGIIISFYFFEKKLVFFTKCNDKNPRPEDQKIFKDIRNLFRPEKETKEIKDRIFSYIENLFETSKSK